MSDSRQCDVKQPDSYRTTWRTEIALRIRQLEHRLDLVQTQEPQGGGASAEISPAERDRRVAKVNASLDVACEAIKDTPWQRPWERFTAWRTGDAITTGWESVHAAEAELAQLESPDRVRAALPLLLAWMRQVMEPEERRWYEDRLTAFIKQKAESLEQTTVGLAYSAVIRANSERHADTRVFRNSLAAVTAAMAVLLTTLAIWHAINPDFVSLCGSAEQPSVADDAAATAAQPQCVSGSEPRAHDVAAIELVGALGGLLAIAFGFGSLRTAPSRYNPRHLLALLKPVAGATTGLIGVLLVQSDVLVAPASTTSESLLLAYAAIFGFSQQLLTRFVDKRAETLLGESSPASSDR